MATVIGPADRASSTHLQEAAARARLARFHRQHRRQDVLGLLAVVPFILVLVWALAVGASTLLGH